MVTATTTHTWPAGRLSWTGEPFWRSFWSACDVDGSLPYWRCARDHGVDGRCSAVYRLTHAVHRRDLPTCPQWPCNGRRPAPRARLPACLGCNDGHPAAARDGARAAARGEAPHLHFFIGACDWYVAELDDETWDASGYANLSVTR